MPRLNWHGARKIVGRVDKLLVYCIIREDRDAICDQVVVISESANVVTRLEVTLLRLTGGC